MKPPLVHNEASVDRRSFISNTIKLAVAGNLLTLEQACKSKSSKPGAGDTTNTKGKRSTHTAKNKKPRQKWHREKLVLNTKTNVVHLPATAAYVYYDEIKRVQDMDLANWENQVQGQVRIHKEQSGNILEILSLQKLKGEVNDGTLSAAIDTLSKAFTATYQDKGGNNYNTTNYRLHELMLQLVALNNTVPPPVKWMLFNEKTKRPPKLGKRQKWMESEASFNERVKYIMERESDYKTRLNKRASKYAIT
ncbi:MAG: hypothetical protein V4722_09365 [Bacteroidota bacterium]